MDIRYRGITVKATNNTTFVLSVFFRKGALFMSETENEYGNMDVSNAPEIPDDTVSTDVPAVEPTDTESVVSDDVTGTEEAQKDKRPTAFIITFNIIVSLILAISIIATAALGMLAYVFQDMKQSVPNDFENLGINSEIVESLPKDDDIVNIALFGIDNIAKIEQTPDEPITGRSDAMIVLSVNRTKKTVKLASVLRDSWVPVEINGTDRYCKINAAYENGGALLAVKTLNRHFGLNIADYVSVCLYQLKTVIDKIGGVEVDVSEKERQYINQHLQVGGEPVEPIEKSGFVHLNGGQAVIYSRIRRIDGEVSRTQRQQEVVFAMIKKVLSKPVTQYPELLRSILSNVETSLTYDEILSYTAFALDKELKLYNITVPGGTVEAERGVFDDTNGLWVYKYDLKKAQEFFHEWIYGTTEFDNSDLESTITTRPDKPNPSTPNTSSKAQSSNKASSDGNSSEQASSNQASQDYTASDTVSSNTSTNTDVSSTEASSNTPTESNIADTSSSAEVDSQQNQATENASQGG